MRLGDEHRPALLACPICGAEPVRNGDGDTGGVLCKGLPTGTLEHRLQVFGDNQDIADATWNTRSHASLPRRLTITRAPHGYADALALVRQNRKPSISFLMRRLRIGYNVAARHIATMQAEGLVSAPDACGLRTWIGGDA